MEVATTSTMSSEAQSFDVDKTNDESRNTAVYNINGYPYRSLNETRTPSATISSTPICKSSSFWTSCGCLSHFSFLSKSEREVLRNMKKRANIPFEALNPQHEALLKQYWQLAFPHEPMVEDISPLWKRLGFQNSNPRSDFRGGGILSLQNMLYFAEHYPEHFQKVLIDVSSPVEFPISAALVNLTQMLVLYFKLNNTTSINPSLGGERANQRSLKVFARLSMDSKVDVFDELFSLSAILLHRQWKESSLITGNALLNFSYALQHTKLRLSHYLETSPETMEELQMHLIRDAETLDFFIF
ncbi:ELMO/CED-12 family protein [Cardiosporidium cionae]|uniref:ELMO/CED-12 family protein n=1 Tax=Cardiosporidium cionae TaxID=476202 RepID=A0ABQ7JB13_9APIC|nr:ELMO/CED-12 family protein [Cardiosporidium cionae]|eukprot:KAF8821188.1 ELMO/CED-12 family protein [Cardiosporidium cionae]